MATRSRKSIAPISIKFMKRCRRKRFRRFSGLQLQQVRKTKIIYKRTTWRYTEGDKYINLTFKNDELNSKDTNLGTN